MASGTHAAFTTDAVLCIELEQAIAAADVWGDGQIKSDS